MSRAPLNHLVRCLRRTVKAHRLDDLTDGELLERFRSQTDPAAFEAIVRRYGERVLAACHKVLADAADVEDTFQATFLVLLRESASIRKRESLGGWLYGVAHRLALQARARAIRRSAAEARKQPRPADEPPDLSWREACFILHEELDRLPETYRLPLILCYLEGKSRDEAAQELGVKPDVLRGRLERGRDRLRGRLARRGITLSVGLLALVANSVTAGGPPESVLRATLKLAAGGRVPGNVASLLHGATPSMTLGKSKLFAIAIVVFGLISGGVGMRMSGAASGPQAAATAAQPPAAKKAAEREETGPVAVSGRVLGPDGKPVSGAKLFIFDSDEWQPAPQKAAGEDGGFGFELPPLASGRSYRYLVATAPDRGLGCDWAGVAAATEPLKDAVLKLPPDVPVQGTLVDLEGKPVAGARVRVSDLQTGKDDTLDEFVRTWSKDPEAQQRALGTLLAKRLFAKQATLAYFSATTDTDGRFTLPGLGRERCAQLTISARGKASQVVIVPIRPGFQPAPGGFTGSPVLESTFKLALAPSQVVRGTVRDAAKKPLAGVRVTGQVDRNNERFVPGYLVVPDVETVTDKEGRYSLDGLPKAKQYMLLADPKPGLGVTHQFAAVPDAPGFAGVTAEFELPRGVELRGRVTDQKSGKPVRAYLFYRPLTSNKWVDLHPGYQSGGIASWYRDAEGWTDNEGRYAITAVPGPGLLHVQVLGHEIEKEYTLARLAPEDDTEEIVNRTFGTMKMFATRGQGGMFSAGNLNAYRVLRIAADAQTATSDVTVSPGVARQLKLVDPDGKPVSGAWIINDRSYSAFTKPLKGSECTIYALEPDHPRRIYAQHEERHLTGLLDLDGKDTGPAVLRLLPAATVVGRVVDQDGKPLKDCRIALNYGDTDLGIALNTREHYNPRPCLTDAEGRFKLENLPSGVSVQLSARPRGEASLGHDMPARVFKPSETLDQGNWKPR